jgi:DNA-binding beta-propeller fold protein YncE
MVRGYRRNNGRDLKEEATTEPAAAHAWSVGDNDFDDAVIAKVWLGGSASEVVTSGDGDLVYVMTADSVKVVNSFHHVVASIPIGPEPKHMMMSSDGSRIYVTGYDGSLSIIDCIDTTAKTVAAPQATAGVVRPDGECIYLAYDEVVGDRSNSWVRAIRADGIPFALVAVDGYTTAMALSPDGRRLYVSSAGTGSEHPGGTIAVIDTTLHTTVDFIPLHEPAETLTVDPDGLLYATHYHANCISMVEPGTRSVVVVYLDDAPIDIVVRPESVSIYTVNLHSLCTVDIWTTASKSLAIGELPRRLQISADGQRLYATDFAHGTVWILHTSDDSVMGTVEVGAHPAAVALSPDGGMLYVTDSRDGTLTVISTDLAEHNPHDA